MLLYKKLLLMTFGTTYVFIRQNNRMNKVKNINTLTLLSVLVDLFLPLNVREAGSCCTWLHSITQTSGRNPLDEGSARRRDLYLTTHNTHNRQTSMPSAGFVPEIAASEHPQTHALDRAATGIGILNPTSYKNSIIVQTLSVDASLPPCPNTHHEP